MVAPLEGIRVVEVANWLAAPSCAALLADMGADVVKVEPPGGDAFRYINLRLPGFDVDLSANYPFQLDNRGKRSVTIALDRPGGSEAVRRLAAQADIFITNLIQRRRVNYGLTVEEIQAVNPACIYVSLSGYGTEGPEAERAGFDYAAFWARSGIMALSGDVQSAPTVCRAGQGDHTTALNLLASTMVALRLRDLTGEGQVVDVTLLGTGLWTIGTDVSRTLVATSVQPPRADRASPSNPLVNSFECSDGRWLLLSMPQADPYWAALCTALGRPEWLGDTRYNSLDARGDNSAELTQELENIFGTRDRDYWARTLNEAGVLWSPVSELPELVADETLRILGAYETVVHPEVGSFETLAAPFSIRGADIQARGPAPSAGANTQEVLAEYGFSEEELSDLAVAGVFG